jgi:peptidoglycan hydrolase CwlO-like protein
MWTWLMTKATFPRFVWAAVALGIIIVASALSVKIVTAGNVIVNATDNFKISLEERKQATEDRKEATKELVEASEFIQVMNERFDQLHSELEDMKAKIRDPEIKERISAAQMDLAARKPKMRDDKFAQWAKGINK